MNVEVNLKVTHLTYKSTMKQKIKLKEINGLLNKNPLDPDQCWIRPGSSLFSDPWIWIRNHEKNRPDPDPCFIYTKDLKHSRRNHRTF